MQAAKKQWASASLKPWPGSVTALPKCHRTGVKRLKGSEEKWQETIFNKHAVTGKLNKLFECVIERNLGIMEER